MRSKEAGVGSWKVGIAIAFGLLGMLSGVATAALKARPEGEPARIILRVHDYAGVPSKVLAEGLVETAKILHAAGVEVSIVVQDFNNVPRSSFGAQWEQKSAKLHRAGLQTQFIDCTNPATAGDRKPICERTDLSVLVVNIVSRQMIPKYQLPSGVFGITSMETDNRPVTHVSIFYPLIEEFSEQYTVPRSALLGLAVAHEVGHALLGTNSHSKIGLMRSHWTAQDLSFSRRPTFVFTAEESEEVRTGVEARSNLEKLGDATHAASAR